MSPGSHVTNEVCFRVEFVTRREDGLRLIRAFLNGKLSGFATRGATWRGRRAPPPVATKKAFRDERTPHSANATMSVARCASPRLAASAAPRGRAGADARRVPAATVARARAVGSLRVSLPGSSSSSPRRVVRRSGEGEPAGSSEEAPNPPPQVKSDPFGFGSSTGEPDKIQPGFDTAEGGKVGPVGTFFITVLLVFLFGASFFFTSVPRNAIEGLVDLSDDPNAPTQRF